MSVDELHRRLLESWNARDAETYSSLLAKNASLVGFDGSMVDGRDAIGEHLSGIFVDHEVAKYVRIVRDVRELADDVALLRAVVGMTPSSKQDLNPDMTAVQSMVAVRHGSEWRIALFQNTPAAFLGRPGEKEHLVAELGKEGSL
jgi:uncharacterized protein (TIGR02246 family)